MNLTSIIEQFSTALIYLAPLIIISFIFRSSWFKGWLGEVAVNSMLRSRLSNSDYHLFKNITLPLEYGTTQIDHVVVSKFGVFVIETKKMKGWIFGSEKQKQWTQKIFKNSHRFQNPLHQNYKHVNALQSLLELDSRQIHSLVVFVGDTTLKTEMPDNVVKGKGMVKYINSKTDQVLGPEEVLVILSRIKDGRLEPSLKTHREHVRHVKDIVTQKQG